MLVQPFVENAIKHGLRNKPGNGLLEIEFRQNHKLLSCTVKEHGIGRKKTLEMNMEKNIMPDGRQESHKSLGMQVTRERLEALSKEKRININFETTDLKDKNGKPEGTQVVIQMPFEKKSSNDTCPHHRRQTLLRNKNGFERITLPTFEGFRFINIKDIVRCEADNNYTNFYLNSGDKILVTKTLKDYDECLSGLDFVRVHQSHLVNIKFVDRYIKGDGGTIVMVDGSQVDVSRRRKDEFLNKMTS